MSTLQEHLDDLKLYRDKRGDPHWNALVVNMVGGHLDEVIAALEAHLSPRSATPRIHGLDFITPHECVRKVGLVFKTQEAADAFKASVQGEQHG